MHTHGLHAMIIRKKKQLYLCCHLTPPMRAVTCFHSRIYCYFSTYKHCLDRVSLYFANSSIDTYSGS